MKYKFKRGDHVTVTVDDAKFRALVLKRAKPVADHEDEPCYELRDLSMKPPFEAFREYESYLKRARTLKKKG
jgi:hypothetical protein